MKKVILINPWIHDFAAVNMWARPLGLLRVAELLSGPGAELRLIDCLDSFRPRRFNMGKYMKSPIPKPGVLKDFPRKYSRYGISAGDFRKRLRKLLPADAVLMTSIMTYWYPGAFEAIRIVKELSPSTPVLLGGIYPTLFHDHARKHSGADMVIAGRAEEALPSVLESLGIEPGPVKTALPWYRLGLYENFRYSPLLTSTGCPFRCSYCASSALQPLFRQRPMDSVIQEVMDLSGLGVEDIAFYDDALLFRPEEHIKPLLREITERKIPIRFHTPNGLHARYLDQETARLMRQAGFVTLRLSLETSLPHRQRETGGKVSNDELLRAIAFLKEAGFTKQNIGVYLMYGLPGQPLDEVREGVRFLMDQAVRVHLAEFSPIPGTPCWDELIRKGTIPPDIDPLLTNNSVYSRLFAGYDPDGIQKLKDEVTEYNRLP